MLEKLNYKQMNDSSLPALRQAALCPLIGIYF